jgi:hypothetical protein
MPAEWETHGPPGRLAHNETDWPGKLDTIRWVYGEMVRKIAPARSYVSVNNRSAGGGAAISGARG